MIGTLGGTIVGTYLGTTLVWVLSGCMVLNKISNLLMACNWISLIVKGVCGPEYFSACISSLVLLVACSVEDNPDMTRCCRNNYTTSVCLYPLVLGVYNV